MEVARNRNSNMWTTSSGKGGLLDSNSKLRSGDNTLESPLSMQLQQAWLQTQLPKRNVPKLDYLSPLPSPDYLNRSSPDPFQQQQQQQQQFVPAGSRSSSFSQRSPSYSQTSPLYSPDTFSEAYSSQSDVGSALSSGGGLDEVGAESEPMEEDMMLQYLSDMLMDEEMNDQKCMYVQCSAYQAMNQELADLIGDGSPTQNGYADPYEVTSSLPELGLKEKEETAENSWIEEVLNSNPNDYLADESLGLGGSQHYNDIAQEVSSMVSGTTSISRESPPGSSSDSTPVSAPSAPASAPASAPTSAPASAPAPVRISTAAQVAAAALDAEKLDDITERLGDISVYECPYLENERTITRVDYTDGRSGIESLAELYPLLMQCAQAVGADDVRGAHQLINQLRSKVSPIGDGGERMGYYIVEALVARLSGTGAQLYTALTSNRPSAVEMLKAYRLFVQCNPLPKISHFFANATIISAVKGSDRIHIVDFGILYGVQWPCLLKKLTMREGGAPRVRITGIDFAQPGFQKNNRVEETGRRLAAKAKELGVEFEYHAIAGKWETITAAQLALRDDETLIVNSMFRLRNLLDETVMASSPRKMVLSKIHSLNPKVFVMGIISAGYNSPFFMARFRETINHFSAVFDALHSSCPPDANLRRLAEQEILGREMLNIIACEGTERIERAETYRQWQSRTINAGFKQLPLDHTIIEKAPEFLKHFNRNYGVAVEGNWLVNGWRDRVLHALTAWRPA